MTIDERLQLMQPIWDQRNRNAEDPRPPAWHGEVLVSREAALECGDEGLEDWHEARTAIERKIKRQDGQDGT